MNYVDVVAGIIWHDGRFIATQRVWGRHAGLWEFPGGKINAGETKLMALARELHEELGITLEEVHHWRTVQHADGEHRRIRLHVYHVTLFSGEPRPMEQQIMRWWTISEACALPFLEADIELVRELAGIAAPAKPVLIDDPFDLVAPPLLEARHAL